MALAAGYLWLARRSRDLKLGRQVFFASGVLVLWLALETPLDPLGDRYSQAAHMTQHVLLGVVAPPLLLLGLSPGMAAFLSRRWSRPLLEPVPAQLPAALVMIGWHLPAAYQLTVSNPAVHIVEHLTFVAAGGVFWWPVLQATSATLRRRLPAAAILVYLLVGTMPQDAVALVLQFSRTLFYPHYANAYAFFPGWTPVVDQDVSGVVLMIAGKTSYAIAALAVFFRWFAADARAAPGAGTPLTA